MMDKRNVRAIGHEAVPDVMLNAEIPCPVCGKRFIYRGAYSHGTEAVCSYHCQRALEKKYRDSSEYREIQRQLSGETFTRRETVEALRTGGAPGYPEGPLSWGQMDLLACAHPKLSPAIFQNVARRVIEGWTYRDIVAAKVAAFRIVRDVRRVMAGEGLKKPYKPKLLTDAEAETVITARKLGLTYARIAEMFEISSETARRVVRRYESGK